VVYPEIIAGNPLGAKCVVRWILCDLGIHCDSDIYKTWGGNDLVFHFSSFNTKYNPNSIDILYNIWVDPTIANRGLPRNGSCYLFKKASSFHKKIKLIHPSDALMIDNLSNEEIINIFNSKEYFYCYDPYSFYDSIAALCGCIPIIYPLEGTNKLEWLKTKAIFQAYLNKSDNVAGIAYGIDDIEYAKNTLQNVWKEKREVIEFGEKTVNNFIDKVDKYFFQKQKDYQFKTLDRMVDILGWNIIEYNKEIIYDKQIVDNLNKLIRQKDQEIALVKSSKFWKLREKYMNFKNKFKPQ
jgi:hypothetical protein